CARVAPVRPVVARGRSGDPEGGWIPPEQARSLPNGGGMERVDIDTLPSRPSIVRIEGDGPELVGDRWGSSRHHGRGEVVLLHGGGQTRHSWGEAARLMSLAGWTVVAYDARGHGQSQWADASRYDVDHFVDDL